MSAARCKCSHAKAVHSRGEGWCWTHPCGCREYRTEYVDPTATELPQSADIQDYLRQKGEQ